jgi:adenosylcobinamide amidohydrolase
VQVGEVGLSCVRVCAITKQDLTSDGVLDMVQAATASKAAALLTFK